MMTLSSNNFMTYYQHFEAKMAIDSPIDDAVKHETSLMFGRLTNTNQYKPIQKS